MLMNFNSIESGARHDHPTSQSWIMKIDRWRMFEIRVQILPVSDSKSPAHCYLAVTGALLSDIRGSYCLIDGSGKTFIQDRAFVLISHPKLQRHQERVSEIRPGLSRRRHGWSITRGREGQRETKR